MFCCEPVSGLPFFAVVALVAYIERRSVIAFLKRNRIFFLPALFAMPAGALIWFVPWVRSCIESVLEVMRDFGGWTFWGVVVAVFYVVFCSVVGFCYCRKKSD